MATSTPTLSCGDDRDQRFQEKKCEDIRRFVGVLTHSAHGYCGGASPLASETRSYDLRSDGYLANLVVRKLANGRPDFIQIVSKSDGKDYPQYQSGPLAEFQVNSTQTPYTYSETIIDDSSVSIVAKFGGRVINKGVRSISADGKTMTIKVVQIGPNSQETPITLVFKRVS